MNTDLLVPDSQRREAFDALVAAVEAARGRGRQPYAASIKPLLKARLSNFDEVSLGYKTFRDFLFDAERAGQIRLELTRGGDYEILPPQSEANGVRRIRADFWTAVTDDRADQAYLYDPATDRVAARAPSEPDTGESEQLIPIIRAATDVQEGWIADFIRELNDATVTAAVGAAPGLSDKLRILNKLLGTSSAWHRARLKAVHQLLQSWAGEHGLAVDFAVPARRPARGAPAGAAHPLRSTRGASPEQQLREHVHRAIDRMPTSDLLRLPIPVEYLVDL